MPRAPAVTLLLCAIALSALPGSESLIVARRAAAPDWTDWVDFGHAVANGTVFLQPVTKGSLGPGGSWESYGSGTTCRSADGHMRAHKIPESALHGPNCLEVCAAINCYGIEYRRFPLSNVALCFLWPEPIGYAKKLTVDDMMSEYTGSPEAMQVLEKTMVADSTCFRLNRLPPPPPSVVPR
uniref:Apple domain-containing protein n=1 Tax=Alexandrium catenella TaxID=2925 RepID=A0A7S1MNG9_ALECA